MRWMLAHGASEALVPSRSAGLGWERERGDAGALGAAWERLQRAALCRNMVWFDGISRWELARGLALTVSWGCHHSTGTSRHRMPPPLAWCIRVTRCGFAGTREPRRGCWVHLGVSHTRCWHTGRPGSPPGPTKLPGMFLVLI